MNALDLRVPAQGVTRLFSMSRSPPGMTTLHMDSGSEYCRFDSYVSVYDTVLRTFLEFHFWSIEI